MKNVLILDTETTGTDPEKDRVIEVGAILFSLDHATSIVSYSTLIRAEGQPAESERVNGIPSASLPGAPEGDAAWRTIRQMAEGARAVLAHNASFDRRFVPAPLREVAPWVCTMSDLQWPSASSSKSLVALALAHGLGVSQAHRALTDCRLIARLMERLAERGVSLIEFVDHGLRPKATFRAIVNYDTNQLAKDAGFRAKYDGGKFSGWFRSMAIEDAERLPFSVERVAS